MTIKIAGLMTEARMIKYLARTNRFNEINTQIAEKLAEKYYLGPIGRIKSGGYWFLSTAFSCLGEKIVDIILTKRAISISGSALAYLQKNSKIKKN